MRSAARLVMGLALCLALVASSHHENAAALEQGKLVAPGRLVVAGRRLSCGATATLLRDFEGFAVSSTVIMLNMQALKDLPRPVQWLIYYHECGHILFGPSETAADCYAVRRARREGWLSKQALEDVCAVFNIAGHGPMHPDPEARCDQLRQCFAKKSELYRAATTASETLRQLREACPRLRVRFAMRDGRASLGLALAGALGIALCLASPAAAPRNGPAMKARPPPARASTTI